jgi:uncharacterized protein
MRNIVAHEYFGIDLEIVWRTITKDLPSLPPLLRPLVQDREHDGGSFRPSG